MKRTGVVEGSTPPQGGVLGSLTGEVDHAGVYYVDVESGALLAMELNEEDHTVASTITTQTVLVPEHRMTLLKARLLR